MIHAPLCVAHSVQWIYEGRKIMQARLGQLRRPSGAQVCKWQLITPGSNGNNPNGPDATSSTNGLILISPWQQLVTSSACQVRPTYCSATRLRFVNQSHAYRVLITGSRTRAIISERFSPPSQLECVWWWQCLTHSAQLKYGRVQGSTHPLEGSSSQICHRQVIPSTKNDAHK